MRSPLNFWRWLRSPGGRDAVKHEIDEELRFHLETRTAENVAEGMAPEEAAREARRRFGNTQAVREECREARGLVWVDPIFQDLKFGARILVKQPVSLISAVAAMALGIGLVTLGFCVLKGFFHQLFPYPQADRLVFTSAPSWGLEEIAKQQTSFEGMAAFCYGYPILKDKALPSHHWTSYVTANFLDVLRMKPMLGRGFLAGEDAPGAAPVALMGYELWQRDYFGDPTTVGSTIWLDGKATTIVGIMPRGFQFFYDQDLWVPSREIASHAFSGYGYANKTGFVFGRLKPEATAGSARAELNTIVARLFPPRTDKSGKQWALPPIRVHTLRDFPEPDNPQPQIVSSAMLLMMCFVLCLACANVAMLTLGRTIKRGTELAVRSALGATRRRLVIQLLVENLILSGGGAVGGLLVTAWLRNWLAVKLGANMPDPEMYWKRFAFDGWVVAFVVGVAFVANLIAGLAPALQATKRDVNECLKGQTLGTSSLGIAGFQQLLIIFQVALSAAILVATMVIVSYSNRLKQVHLPFDPATMYCGAVELLPPGDPKMFFEELDRNLRQLPGVDSAALTTCAVPGAEGTSIQIEGYSYSRTEDFPRASGGVISPGFFDTMKMPLLQGRSFRAEDRAGTLPVAVVNAAFVAKFLTKGSPLGRRFREGTNGPWLTTVGLVPDLISDSYHPDMRWPGYYVPMSQQSPMRSMTIMFRASGSAGDWSQKLRGIVTRLEANVAFGNVETMKDQKDRDIFGFSVAIWLLAVCGAGSLFLATLGIFGLITLSVNQRTREIGIRLALGATRTQVAWAILRPALTQIGIGLLGGIGLGFAIVRIVSSVVDLPTNQPWVYLAVGLGLGLVSLIAVFIPARRGSRLDPMIALRYE